MKVAELIERAEAFDGALETPCLILPNKPRPDGYVYLMAERREGYAHVLVYEEMVGPVPAGLDLDHLCRWRACMNWTHVEPVTRQVNVLRGEGVAARHAAKTHCKHNHPLSGENLYVHPSGRQRACRECVRRWGREYQQRKKASQ